MNNRFFCLVHLFLTISTIALLSSNSLAQFPPVGCYTEGVLCDSVQVEFDIDIVEFYDGTYWNGGVQAIGSHPDLLNTGDMGDYSYVNHGDSYFYSAGELEAPEGRIAFSAGATGYQSSFGFQDLGGYLTYYLDYTSSRDWWAMWTVPDDMPISIPDTTSTNGLTVNFNGSRSYEAEEGQKVPVAEYDWYFGVPGSGGSGPTPSYTYPGPGTYTARLIVTDNDGDIKTAYITFKLGPPQLSVKAEVVQSTQPDFRLTIGDSVLVRAVVSNTGESSVYSLNIANEFNLPTVFPEYTYGTYKTNPSYEPLGDDTEITIPVLAAGDSAPPVERWYKVTGFGTYQELGVTKPIAVKGYPVMTLARGENLDGTPVVAEDVCGYELCDEQWVVRPPRIFVDTPTTVEPLVAGEPTTLHWDRDLPGAVSLVTVVLHPDTLGAAPIALASFANIDSLNWTPSTDLFTRSARVVVHKHDNPAIADTTAFFKIKPYRLTRLIENETKYEPFKNDKHGWQFSNTRPFIFPIVWWIQDQFNYPGGGTDPFTNLTYNNSNMRSSPSHFADWPAFTRAFGTDDAFWYFIPGVISFYNESFVAQWRAFHGGTGWKGSCSGMAASSLLMFADRDAFASSYPQIGAAEELFTLPISDPIRETINSLYCYWLGQAAQDHYYSYGGSSPRQTLEDLKTLFMDDDRSNDGYLYMKDTNGGGAHAVAPVGLERLQGGEGFWLLHIYDPNIPGTDAVVFLDSLSNEWSYEGFNPVWSGAGGLFLMDPVSNYLTEAIPLVTPVTVNQKDIPSNRDEMLYFSAVSGADIVLTALDGSGSISYVDSVFTNELPGASFVIPPVGGFSPPNGFNVPAGAYSLGMTDPPDSLVMSTVLAPGLIYSHDRTDALANQEDHLTFDPTANAGSGELTVRGEGSQEVRRIDLRAVLTDDPNRERTLMINDLVQNSNDSVRFGVMNAPTTSELKLRNQGASSSYTLRLRQASRSGGQTFSRSGVPFVANAIHIIRPNWSDLFASDIEVEVDLNSDGTVDQILTLVNEAEAQISPVEQDDLPTVVKMHKPFPNPFNGQSTVMYDLPTAAHVKVALYDLRGRQVDVLVDSPKEAGRHQAIIQSRGLASGIYLVRMTTAGKVVTQRVTLVQ